MLEQNQNWQKIGKSFKYVQPQSQQQGSSQFFNLEQRIKASDLISKEKKHKKKTNKKHNNLVLIDDSQYDNIIINPKENILGDGKSFKYKVEIDKECFPVQILPFGDKNLAKYGYSSQFGKGSFYHVINLQNINRNKKFLSQSKQQQIEEYHFNKNNYEFEMEKLEENNEILFDQSKYNEQAYLTQNNQFLSSLASSQNNTKVQLDYIQFQLKNLLRLKQFQLFERVLSVVTRFNSSNDNFILCLIELLIIQKTIKTNLNIVSYQQYEQSLKQFLNNFFENSLSHLFYFGNILSNFENHKSQFQVCKEIKQYLQLFQNRIDHFEIYLQIMKKILFFLSENGQNELSFDIINGIIISSTSNKNLSDIEKDWDNFQIKDKQQNPERHITMCQPQNFSDWLKNEEKLSQFFWKSINPLVEQQLYEINESGVILFEDIKNYIPQFNFVNSQKIYLLIDFFCEKYNLPTKEYIEESQHNFNETDNFTKKSIVKDIIGCCLNKSQTKQHNICENLKKVYETDKLMYLQEILIQFEKLLKECTYHINQNKYSTYIVRLRFLINLALQNNQIAQSILQVNSEDIILWQNYIIQSQQNKNILIQKFLSNFTKDHLQFSKIFIWIQKLLLHDDSLQLAKEDLFKILMQYIIQDYNTDYDIYHLLQYLYDNCNAAFDKIQSLSDQLIYYSQEFQKFFNLFHLCLRIFFIDKYEIVFQALIQSESLLEEYQKFIIQRNLDSKFLEECILVHLSSLKLTNQSKLTSSVIQYLTLFPQNQQLFTQFIKIILNSSQILFFCKGIQNLKKIIKQNYLTETQWLLILYCFVHKQLLQNSEEVLQKQRIFNFSTMLIKMIFMTDSSQMLRICISELIDKQQLIQENQLDIVKLYITLSEIFNMKIPEHIIIELFTKFNYSKYIYLHCIHQLDLYYDKKIPLNKKQIRILQKEIIF